MLFVHVVFELKSTVLESTYGIGYSVEYSTVPVLTVRMRAARSGFWVHTGGKNPTRCALATYIATTRIYCTVLYVR